MAASPPGSDSPFSTDLCLQGERILFVGKLTSMSRRESRELVMQHGAMVVDESSPATLVVIGDNYPDLASALHSDASGQSQLGEEFAAGRVDFLHESELWQRLGLVSDEDETEAGVRKLYTPAMLAELLDVPVSAVRRWHRNGALVARQSVRRLPYFDFSEVAIARHLSSLFAAGCSLRVIDRKLAELQRSLPDVERPLADPSVVVTGRCLYLRRGEDLAEPGGQLLIDFDKPADSLSDDSAESEMVLSMATGVDLPISQTEFGECFSEFDELLETALEWEDQGELQRAAETYRTLLVANGPTAELNFALADLLYRSGDLPAARERYYAAIELDEEYVEARANLGSVLAENGELELAVAAFEGALTFHRDYADVHYHLAGTLDRLNRPHEADVHWQTFLALAPESPWAEMARTRLGVAESDSTVCNEL